MYACVCVRYNANFQLNNVLFNQNSWFCGDHETQLVTVGYQAGCCYRCCYVHCKYEQLVKKLNAAKNRPKKQATHFAVALATHARVHKYPQDYVQFAKLFTDEHEFVTKGLLI